MSAPGEFFVRWRVRLGYPLAIVCFWLARPTLLSLAIGAGIAAPGLLLRGAAAGHLNKLERLATSGPYAYTRNPLYLGSALLAAGFLMASRSWSVAALVAAYFVVFYAAVMRREEQELRSRFGAAFNDYAARVPLFWPRFATGGAARGAKFSWAVYHRNREDRAALGFLAAMALLWLRMRLRG